MKLVKFLIVFFFVFSCKKQEFEPSESLTFSDSFSLRLSIQSIKKIKNLIPKNIDLDRINSRVPSDICFDFKYPVVFEYNDNSKVVVNSFSQFIELILNESLDLHMTGIGFPFTVVMLNDGSELNISNENEFETLIVNCGYGSLSFDEIKEFYGSCFDFNYPISVILNGVTYKFNSENDAILLAAAFDQKIVSFNFVYPFSIKYLLNNQNITVSDYYTFGSVLSNCD